MKTSGYSSQVIHDITDHIREDLVNYYQNNTNKNKYYTIPLSDLVKLTIEEDLKNESEAEELRRMYTNKKRTMIQKKKRQYESCCKMVETRAWENDDIDRYCFKSEVLAHNMFTTEQWNTAYSGKTLEEVQMDRLKEVEDWYKQPDSLMIHYPGQERKTPKRQFDNFKSDLALDILSVMKQLYNWDMENLTFPIMDDLADKPVFSAKREVLLRQPDSESNSIVIFSSEDGRRRTVLTFDEAAFDDKDKVVLFDYKDSNILSYLLKSAIKYNGGTLPILIEKTKLIKAAYNNSNKKPNSRDYDEIDMRLKKLSHATIDNYVDNEWTGSFHMVDAVEKQDIDSRKYVAFYPSDYMITQIESDGVSQLPTDLKNKLDTDAAKLLYVPLMLQRVKAYKKMRANGSKNDFFEVVFQYGHFLRFVNFGKRNQKDNHEEIIKVLEEYKNKGIFIHDYKYVAKTKTYHIIFNPLTEIEIQDLGYYFGEDYVIDDIDFKQIDVFSFIEND